MLLNKTSMMSLREYVRPNEDVLFVNDMIKSAKANCAEDSFTGQAPPLQRQNHLHDRIKERQRALDGERWNVESRKRAADLLEIEAEALTRPFQLRAKRLKLLEVAQIRKELTDVESGAKAADFELQVRPYLDEYQKQQFGRNHEACEEGNQAPSKEFKVLEDFLTNVEGQHPKFQIQAADTCAQCSNEPMQLHQALSMLICPKCGASRPFLDATASLLAYSDDYDYSSFSYKRINHFAEWLASIQAKESMELPAEVLESIMQRLYDERVQELGDVTVHKVREVLKKLKLRKYYEHVQLITCKITGRVPPRMTPEMEERLKVCFLAASASFQRHIPEGRKNMVSYALVTHRLCAIVGFTDFLPFFAPLKSREKMAKADACWKLICDDLGWPFLPSLQ